MKKSCFCLFLLVGALLPAKQWLYESHFPILPEPWYFRGGSIDTDGQGNVYVSSVSKIFKLDPNGHVLRILNPTPIFPTGNDFGALQADAQGNVFVIDTFPGWQDPISVLRKIDQNGNSSSVYKADYDSFVIDSSNNFFLLYADKVVKTDANFNTLMTFGSLGQAPGQFYFVGGLAVAPNGNLYVCDSGNYRIQVFDSTGQFLYLFGSKGTNPDQFQAPVGIALDQSGNVYVYDSNLRKIKIFDPQGNYVSQWGTAGNSEGQVSKYEYMAFIHSNKLFFSSGYLSRIQYFSLSGSYLGQWGSTGTAQGMMMRAGGVEVDNSGDIYVADTENYRFQKFNKKLGIQMAVGSYGTGPGQFLSLKAIAVDDEGHIFVLDDKNMSVQKFDKKGIFMAMWKGDDPWGPYLFEDPWDLAVDRDGYVYVLNRDGSSVLKFSSEGAFITQFYLNTNGQADVSAPVTLAVDNQRRLLVAKVSSFIHTFSSTGEYIGSFDAAPTLVSVRNIDVDSQGRIFAVGVANVSSSRGAVFDASGAPLGTFGDGTDILRDLSTITGIAAAPDGTAVVLEQNRVLTFRSGPGSMRTVPAAASIRGALGTDWRTDLSIFNPGSSAIDVTLDYYKADGALTSSFILQPSAFLFLPDVIGTTFNAPNTFGALTAVCLDDDQPLIFSRTYNQVEQGTYGQGIRASPYGATFYQGELAFLTGLKNTASFRSNVGFFNLQDIPIEVQLVLYDEAGVELASAAYPLAALSHLQVNNIFLSLSLSGDHEAAWALVWSDTLWGRFAAYGSIVDNRTGDPIYLEAKPMGGTMPEDFHWILPAVASTPGAYGTNWRTEAVFTNPPLESNDVTLTYHPATGGDPFVFTFTLEPGEVEHFSDFLDEAYALSDSFGWLEIVSSCAGLQARARIFTGETGTYGQGLQAQQQNTLSLETSPVYLLNLLENESYRSNLGLLNIAETETVFTLDLLKDSSVVSSKTLTLSGQTLQQLNGVLSSFFGTSGDGYTVRITGPEGATYTAYLSTVDNRTGDAVYQSFSSQ